MADVQGDPDADHLTARAARSNMSRAGREQDKRRGEKCALLNQKQRIPTPPYGQSAASVAAAANFARSSLTRQPEKADNRAYGPENLENAGLVKILSGRLVLQPGPFDEANNINELW